MLKIIPPGAQDFSEPVAQLIKLSSRGLLGLDRQLFVKRAGAWSAHQLDSMEFAPGEVPIHLNAVGATEGFGMNRNGDFFPEAACEKYHDTFVKHARWYRSHQNKNPAKSYGLVKHSAYNKPMRRIELIVALNGSIEAAKRNGGLVADEELEKLANDEEIATSMACFLDPDYPILTRDRNYVRIADIRVGDYVLNRERRWTRVTTINRRKYTGEVCKLHINSLPFPLEVTADHLLWAKVFTRKPANASAGARGVTQAASRYFKDTAAFNAAPAEWVPAGELAAGDRLFYAPISRYTGYAQIADLRLAALCGYYLAEGCVAESAGNINTAYFACHIDDSLPRRLPGIVESMYAQVTVDILPHRNSKLGLMLAVHSAHLARFLAKHMGRSAHSKYIPPEIFNAAKEMKLAFLGAWLDGDGWLDKKGTHWSTASINLVLQGRDLLASLGIGASIYRIDHSKCATSGYENSGIEYTLNVSHLETAQFSDYSTKAAAYTIPRVNSRTKPASMRACPDGNYAMLLKQITRRHVTDLVTYNFEVEDGESYSAAGLISHNCLVDHDICSHCGNKARNRREYCDSIENGGHCKAGGLKRHMGQVLDDGSQLGAINADPRWIDISNVWRPADRICYTFGQLKAAGDLGQNIGGAELAELAGLSVPYAALADSTMSGDSLTQLKIACALAEAEENPAPNPWGLAFSPLVQPALQPPDSLHYKRAEVFRALADEHIVLPLPQFLQLATSLTEKQAVATAEVVAPLLTGSFRALLGAADLSETLRTNPYNPGRTAPASLRKWASALAPDFSFAEPWLSRRMQLAALRGGTVPPPAGTEKVAGFSAPVFALSQQYALYKLATLAEIFNTSQHLDLDADLCRAAKLALVIGK